MPERPPFGTYWSATRIGDEWYIFVGVECTDCRERLTRRVRPVAPMHEGDWTARAEAAERHLVERARREWTCPHRHDEPTTYRGELKIAVEAEKRKEPADP